MAAAAGTRAPWAPASLAAAAAPLGLSCCVSSICGSFFSLDRLPAPASPSVAQHTQHGWVQWVNNGALGGGGELKVTARANLENKDSAKQMPVRPCYSCAV